MKSITLLSSLVAAATLTTTTHAVTYYNCTSTSGCTQVRKWHPTEAWQRSNYTQTKYPIILQHGMSGSSENTPASFYGIPEDLALNGSQVFLTETTGFQNSEIRGEMLLQQLQTIQAITQSEKFNLIGHSHGGFDIRYVAGVRPDLVASATAVGSPTRGSEVADFIQGIKETIAPYDQGKLTNFIGDAVNLLGKLSDVTNTNDNLKQDSLAGLYSLTKKGTAEFNQKFPVAIEQQCDSNTTQAHYSNGVAYYSWSGTSQLTNPVDPLDYGLAILNVLFKGQPNDGLVSRCSSHVGYVVRDNYGMNHLDEINQTLGLVNLFEANPKAVHRAQVNRLKQQGF